MPNQSKEALTEKRLKAEGITSELILKLKYAAWLEDKKRRENWPETVGRTLNMFRKKFAENQAVLDLIEQYKDFIYQRKILPAMRVLQFAGNAIEIDNSRLYNCAYTNITCIQDFYEIFFLLMGGTGVGFSLKPDEYSQLPPIKREWKGDAEIFEIPDSRQGWCQSVVELLNSYTGARNQVEFDYSKIRPAGAPLKTSGGVAPGFEPLKRCLDKIRNLLDKKEDGEKFDSLEVYDIICFISDSVLAGGIRRASLIALFMPEDEKMFKCKTKESLFDHPDGPQTQRYRSNNSIILDRDRLTPDSWKELWNIITENGIRDGSGEPGFFYGIVGTNPCAEVGLWWKQFCNLVEINGSTVVDQKDFNERCEAAAFFATLQASFTNFPDLSPGWKEKTEEEALIGVGITGIMDGIIMNLDLVEGATIVKASNTIFARLVGIKPAARTTVIKPCGTTSLLLSTTSGVHAPFFKYGIRHIRINKNDPILKVLEEFVPELIEPEEHSPTDVVLKIPMMHDSDCKTRDTETAIEFLERVKYINQTWIKAGHRYGDITNNVSATACIKDYEWEEVGPWMWENRAYYNAISFIKYDTTFYKHLPFQKLDTKEEYEELLDIYLRLDLSKLSESENTIDHLRVSACTTEYCEITSRN